MNTMSTKYLQIVLAVSAGAILALTSGSPLESEETRLGLRLIKTSKEGTPTWLSEKQIWSSLIRKHKHFIDVTDHTDMLEENEPPSETPSDFPTTLSNQNVTMGLLSAIKEDRIHNFVNFFSSYHTRYYKGNSGVQSQKWLLTQVQESLEGYTASTASVEEFKHNWPQSSIIAKIEGTDPDLKSEVIILGAHQDSINIFGGSFRAPGADDNAAGSVVVLESLRAIVDTGFAPKRTVEFHWYAAEEVGLRGSAAIAQSYKNNGVNVVGMLNFDVPGYQTPDVNDVGIYTDNTNPQLNQFLRLLVDEYLDYGRQDCKCGYGCSDHASWTNYGFPAAMPAEVELHPQMHTSLDNYSRVGFTQLKEFVKLSLSALAEFGQPGAAAKAI